jgi:hypothetical protein
MPYRKYQACIEACNASLVACEHCAASCLQEKDVAPMIRCIQLDRSCADICALAIREMARGSEFAVHVCHVCVEICEACGGECRKHQMDHCQRCAEACRKCADECRRVGG